MIRERCITVVSPEPYNGPYDLEHWSFELRDDQSVVLRLDLGMLYDNYSLECAFTLPVTWELWHNDSAVMHVDRSLLMSEVRFSSERVELPPLDEPFLIDTGEEAPLEIVHAWFYADSDMGEFRLELEGERTSWIFDQDGIRLEERHPLQ